MAKLRKRPAESWTYVLAADRAVPLEQQTRFTLRPMTHAERAAVRDGLARQQTNVDGSVITLQRMRQEAYEIALHHIVTVENFPVGAPALWPAHLDDRRAYLEQLEDDDVLELGDEVWARSTLGPAVPENIVKNSSPPERISDSGGASAVASSTTAAPAPRIPD